MSPTRNSEDGSRPAKALTARAERFPIHTLVTFREVGAVDWQEGQSINISRTGILFKSEHIPKPQETLEMRIVFPKELTHSAPMNVICWGHVARIAPRDPADPLLGAALAIRRHRFSQV